MELITLLIYLLIAAVVIYIVWIILGLLPIPPAIRQVIGGILTLIFLLWIVRLLVPGIFP